ncbi:MAG: hypothetical protein RQ714_01035 [Nitrosomonas sp.]|nr:hypothetical protein [Nitrosomonas sp.]
MKKILLTLLLMLASTSTMADWIRISESDQDGGYTVYADLVFAHKAAGKAKMWILLDFKTKQKASGVNFLSKTIRREYDCRGKHARILAFKLFSWNMERGKLVRSYMQPQEWRPVQPESLEEIEWKAACDN